MPEFLTESEEEVRERFRRALEAERGPSGERLFPDQDTPGSPSHNNRELWARVLRDTHQQLNRLVGNQSPLYAEGPALSEWASYFGVERSEPSRGSGRVLITSDLTGRALEETRGSRALGEGTLLERGREAVAVLSEEARIPLEGNAVEVRAASARAGDRAPIASGTRLSVAEGALSGAVRGEVTSPVQGGTSRETDEQLRFRLARALRSPSTIEGLRADLLGDDAVRSVEIDESAYGPGTVEVFVSPAVAYPLEEDRLRIESRAAGPSKIYVVFPAYEGLALQVETTAEGERAREAVAAWIGERETGETVQVETLESDLTRRLSTPVQVVGAARGEVEEGQVVSLERMGPARQFTPRSPRGKFYLPPSAVRICAPQTAP